MAKKPVNSAIKEDAKIKAAEEASARRAKKKGSKNQTKIYIACGTCGVAMIFGIWLAITADSPKAKGGGGVSKDSTMVNDASFIRSVTLEASGNFTAADSPFFNRWTHADVKYGLDGVELRGQELLGMAGALQRCEDDSGLEGGVLPSSYDVREAWPTCVNEVIDSGNCSSGYAIAAASALASRFCIADSGKYSGVKLSAQQILSCDKASRGCNGGGADSVFAYIQRRGLYPEECVPYAGVKGAACKTTCEDSKKLKMIDHCVLSGEKAVKREIYNRGPVVMPMYIKDDLLVYESGIYSPIDRSMFMYGTNNEPLLQAVLVIGWGKSESTRYWIVANSWGTSWGEKGFAKVAVDTSLRESYALVGFPATEEAIQEKAKKEEEQQKRREEARKERALRDERIRERQRQRMEEEKAAQDAKELEEMDDIDLEGLEDEIDLEAEVEDEVQLEDPE